MNFFFNSKKKSIFACWKNEATYESASMHCKINLAQVRLQLQIHTKYDPLDSWLCIRSGFLKKKKMYSF